MVARRVSEELKFRSHVVKLLRPLLAFPIENTADVGTPDIGCIAGFIELKIAKRPVRVDTPVAIDVRNSQRIWMRRWCAHGGKAWFLTRLDDLWIIHDGAQWATEHLGSASEVGLKQFSCWYSVEKVTSDTLTQVFCDLADLRNPLT